MPTVHMICGLIGAGKTTLAERLQRELPALRLTLDQWVMQLFGPEAPEPMNFEWWLDRNQRCAAVLWPLCQQALAAGTDVILDWGFLQLHHRDEYRALARAEGADVVLHYVRTPTPVRYQRVQQRNRERGSTYSITVTDSMFDSLEWDPPAGQELEGARIVDN